MHVRMPMLSLSLLTLSSLAAAAPQDSQDTSSDSWSPFSSSYTLFLPEQRDVLRFGTLEFDSEVLLSSGSTPKPFVNLIARRQPTEEEKWSDTASGREVREETRVAIYRISRSTIRSIFEWLVSEESMLEWACDIELPSGSVLTGFFKNDPHRGPTRDTTSRKYPQRPPPSFLIVKVLFEDGEAKRTVQFAGRVLTDQEVKEFVAYLKAIDDELEAIEGRI